MTKGITINCDTEPGCPDHLEQTNLVRSLLSNDPTLLNSTDDDGRTALHWASSSSALDIVRDLLSHNEVEVDKRDNASWTPLMIAGTVAAFPLSKRVIESASS